nr:MAG TPA: hypothetical protein [Caudoviricetes sp.]
MTSYTNVNRGKNDTAQNKNTEKQIKPRAGYTGCPTGDDRLRESAVVVATNGSCRAASATSLYQL